MRRDSLDELTCASEFQGCDLTPSKMIFKLAGWSWNAGAARRG
jgi:hypothetical protein